MSCCKAAGRSSSRRCRVTVAAQQQRAAGPSRSREGAADRQPGLRRLSRCRRQQRHVGESKPRRAARRLYHPATRALQGGHSRQSDHAGHGRDAVGCRHEGAGRLLLATEAEGPRGEGRRDGEDGATAFPRRRRGDAACPPARRATRRPARASRRIIRASAASTPITPTRNSRRSRRASAVPTRTARTPTAGSWRRSQARMTDAQMKAVADYMAGLRN